VMNDRITLMRHRHEALKAKVASHDLSRVLDNMRIRLDGLDGRVKQAFELKRSNTLQRLERVTELLKARSPLGMFEKGFSYVTDREGRNLSRTEQFKAGQNISLRVSDGTVNAVVSDTETIS